MAWETRKAVLSAARAKQGVAPTPKKHKNDKTKGTKIWCQRSRIDKNKCFANAQKPNVERDAQKCRET